MKCPECDSSSVATQFLSNKEVYGSSTLDVITPIHVCQDCEAQWTTPEDNSPETTKESN